MSLPFCLMSRTFMSMHIAFWQISWQRQFINRIKLIHFRYRIMLWFYYVNYPSIQDSSPLSLTYKHSISHWIYVKILIYQIQYRDNAKRWHHSIIYWAEVIIDTNSENRFGYSMNSTTILPQIDTNSNSKHYIQSARMQASKKKNYTKNHTKFKPNYTIDTPKKKEM